MESNNKPGTAFPGHVLDMEKLFSEALDAAVEIFPQFKEIDPDQFKLFFTEFKSQLDVKVNKAIMDIRDLVRSEGNHQ